MCAISGVLDLAVTEEVLQAMHETMIRRGPDGKGVYRDGRCSLLHARLAVIDPEGGSQPMMLNWAGERYVLVYNGELYNTRELRRELEGLGHGFSGHSDTEVVLHSYVQWGAGCLERFNGIFAFGIWEVGGKRAFLARDRIGVKPLFYRETGGGLVFASEIKTILACPWGKAELDREGAAELLLLGPGRRPGSGVFRGIRELEPGCMARYENGRLRVKRYWKLTDREHRDTLAETVERVRYLVEDAIRRQMVADVPLGTFLSGGLDSGIISSVCAAQLEGQGRALPTFSLDYENNDVYFQSNAFQPDRSI